MLLCTSGKSCYEFRVEVQGKSCHSCNPSNGINANYIVAKLVGEIENLNMCLPNTTLCANVIGGGEKANIVSSSAFVVFDLRTDDNQKLLIVKKKLENFIKKLESDYPGAKIKLITTLDILPYNNFAKNEIIQQINKQCETTEAIFEGACEAGYYQSLGGEAVVFGCGDLSLAHNPNEYLEIKKYEQYDQSFKKIMKIVENKFNF